MVKGSGTPPRKIMRYFLRFIPVFLAPLTLPLIFPFAEASGRPIHHAQGELSGEVTPTSALLQSRLTTIPGPSLDASGDLPGAEGVACFEWSRNADFSSANRTSWIKALPESDFIVRSRIEGLQPDTLYYYRLRYGATEAQAKSGQLRSFRTLAPNNDRRTLSFCIGNCMHYYSFMSGHPNGGGPVTATPEDKALGFPAFAAMLKLKPDFYIGAGDTVYYDHPLSSPAKTQSELRRKWHEEFRFPRMVEFFASTPAYWMKDDHDFRYDDSDLTGDQNPSPALGIATFREQLPILPAGDSTSPGYRTHRIHPAVQLWFLEGRDYRSPNTMADGPDKTIWGNKQLEWLERTLLESDAIWKIIITPTPVVGPDRANKTDNMTNPRGFRHEADEFLAWLVEHKLTNVLFICGDRHWQYHSIHPLGFEEFSMGALNDENSILGVKPGDKNSTDPDGLVRQPFLYQEPSGGFLHVTVNGAKKTESTLKIQFINDRGKVLHVVEKKSLKNSTSAK